MMHGVADPSTTTGSTSAGSDHTLDMLFLGKPPGTEFHSIFRPLFIHLRVEQHL